MTQQFSNNASGTLLADITESETQVTLDAGQGAAFPQPIPAAGSFFVAALEDTLGNIEIVTVTDRNGDILTIARGKEGTTGLVFTTGDRLELRLTAESLNAFFQKSGGTVTGPVTFNSYSLTDYALGDFIYTASATRLGGIPTRLLVAPQGENSADYTDMFTGGRVRRYGISDEGYVRDPGWQRHYWFEGSVSDPEWYVDVITRKPDDAALDMRWEPSPTATSVTYTFVTKDELGNESEVRLNQDGSLTQSRIVFPFKQAFGDENIVITYIVNEGSPIAAREVLIEHVDDGGGSSEPIQYRFVGRDIDGNTVEFVLDADGQINAPKLLVSRAYASSPVPLTSNELTTRSYVQGLLGGEAGPISGLYYSTELFVGSLSSGQSGTLVSDLSLFDQIIVETLQAGSEYQTSIFDVATLRINVVYSEGDAAHGGRTRYKFPNTTSIQCTAGDHQVKRVIAIAFAGDPVPAP